MSEVQRLVTPMVTSPRLLYFLPICKGDPKPEGKFFIVLVPHFFFSQSSLKARTQGYKPGRVGSMVRNVLPLPLTLAQLSTRLSKLAFLLVSLFCIDSLCIFSFYFSKPNDLLKRGGATVRLFLPFPSVFTDKVQILIYCAPSAYTQRPAGVVPLVISNLDRQSVFPLGLSASILIRFQAILYIAQNQSSTMELSQACHPGLKFFSSPHYLKQRLPAE